jgi:hypothetical protein
MVLSVAARLRFLLLFFSLAMITGLAGRAQAQIALYPLGANGETSDPAVLNAGRSGTGYEATIVDPNATASGITISDSIPPSAEQYIEITSPSYVDANGNQFPVFRFQPGNNSRTPAEAITKDKYFTFQVTANAGVSLNLANLTFDVARGGSATPRGYVVLSDVDGFTNPIDSEDVPSVRPDLTTFTIDLSGPSYQGLAEVTFRIYAYTPSGGQSVEFSNLTLNGTVQ